MNRTKLKNYAPQARRDFIQAVTDRAAYYGLSADKIEPVTAEQGDTAIIGGRAFPRAVLAKRAKLIERIKRHGFTPTMEALAYTWFNRFVAIRFMELHGYLDHGYRVLSHPEDKDTPEILAQAEHVDLPGLNRAQVIELKLDGTKEAELYRLLLVAQCNALHAAMPFLFERVDDETELLLPDNLLHSDSLIRKLVREIDEADWQGNVEIIGWLYQFYISERKDEVIGKVVRSEDIPAATQLFTPNWIVKYMVQNSIGRMWLQTYPDSTLRSKMEYYLEPAEQTPEVQTQLATITPATIDPETITVLDPACGSGHILVEAYDLLKEIYLERGYRLRDIPRLILGKNLFGLDIDDRAAQLAAFALLMKARADDRRILTAEHTNGAGGLRLNVLAIHESGHLNAEQLASDLLDAPAAKHVPLVPRAALFDDLSAQMPLMTVETTQGMKTTKAADPAIRNLQSAIGNLLELFRQAKTFGSLLTIPDDIARQLPAIAELINERLQSGNVWERPTAETLLPFVQQASLLAGKYHCVIANPPYMGSKFYNAELKNFVNRNYAEGKADLYGCFTMRNAELSKQGGRVAMLTIPNWMFLSSFEPLREIMLNDLHIETLLHNGRGVFGSDFGSCAYTLARESSLNKKGVFKRLFDTQGSVASNEELRNRFFEKGVFQASSDDFKKIPGSPIAYWVSDKVREIFETGTPLGEFAEPRQGMATSDNSRFLRLWFEVNQKRIGFGFAGRQEAQAAKLKWFPYNKGGEFRKWYGNNDYVLNFEEDGREVLAYAAKLYGSPTRTIKSISQYFKPSVTWSFVSSSYFGVRRSDAGFIFDVGGSSAFPPSNKINLVTGFLCSSITFQNLRAINPTLNFQAGNVASLPILEEKVSEIKSQVDDIVEEAVTIARADWDSFETSWDFQMFPLLRVELKAATTEQSLLNWQTQCEANIRRMQELETENNRLFIEAYGLQDELSPDVPEEQITLARADREADIKRLVSYAVGCIMGRYRLDRPGLVYAHSGNQDFEQIYHATPSATEGASASRANEPQSVFLPDPDGIVPVLDNDWFEDDAANRLVEFIGKAWPSEQLEANLRYIAESLSATRDEDPRATIRRYFAAGFFKDHLQRYKKRPIYWLFSSGKQRAFQCLVYLHRYHAGTLARMRTEYVIPLQGKLTHRIRQLEEDKLAATSTSHRRKLEKEQDTLKKQQTELLAFDEKLRHYADQRITLDLDDGVKVNYGKFGDLLAEVKAVTGGSDE